MVSSRSAIAIHSSSYLYYYYIYEKQRITCSGDSVWLQPTQRIASWFQCHPIRLRRCWVALSNRQIAKNAIRIQGTLLQKLLQNKKQKKKKWRKAEIVVGDLQWYFLLLLL